VKKRQLIGILVLVGLIQALTGPALGGSIVITNKPFNAVPDDNLDDTAAIQKAFDVCNGDTVVIPKGKYIVGRWTLRPPGDRPIRIVAEPGSTLVFVPADGVTICIDWTQKPTENVILRSIERLTIHGPMANKEYPVGATPGKLVGLRLLNIHRGELRNLVIEGFDRAGLEIAAGTLDGGGAYYWEINNLIARYNGWGVLCSGLANATSFSGFQAQYNIYGYENIQWLTNLKCEGNYRSGARYTEGAYRVTHSIHNYWFEQNNQNGKLSRGSGQPGEADIWANALPEYTDQNYKPISLALSGAGHFAPGYGPDDRPETYAISGCLEMSVSGGMIIRPRGNFRYNLHPMSRVLDVSEGFHLMDPETGGGPQASHPFNYARPTWMVTQPGYRAVP
jgi:hypothetical protein